MQLFFLLWETELKLNERKELKGREKEEKKESKKKDKKDSHKKDKNIKKKDSHKDKKDSHNKDKYIKKKKVDSMNETEIQTNENESQISEKKGKRYNFKNDKEVPFELLNDDILFIVFKCMDGKDVLRLLVTCRKWIEKIENEDLWSRLCNALSIGTYVKIDNITWYKSFVTMVTMKYMKFIIHLNENKDNIEDLILDINLGVTRQIKSSKLPRWREDNQRLREDIQKINMFD